MTPKARRARAHTLLYRVIQQAIDSDLDHADEETGCRDGETVADKVAIHREFDRWAQFHFNRSDKA